MSKPAPTLHHEPDQAPGLPCQAGEAERALRCLRQHGDRTNSLVTLYPGFSSHEPEGLGGVVRFQEKGGTCLIASEPLMAEQDRTAGVLDFIRRVSPDRPCHIMPVGERLAGELRERGLHVWQVGSEPIFDLAEYFRAAPDPLLLYPVARALQRRGGKVDEVVWEDLPPEEAERLRQEMEDMRAEWLEKKSSLPLEFLSRVMPLHLAEEKRFFRLRVRGEMQAYIAAAPYYRRGEVLGYYFLDTIRRPAARAGAGDLLVLEAMRLLGQRGIREVRLGMAPLAGLPTDSRHRLLASLFRRWRWGYNFQTLHRYKSKLHPTRWEPLYIASTSASLARVVRDAVRAHLPGGLFNGTFHVAARAWGSSLALKTKAAARLGIRGGVDLLPKSFGDYIWRTKYTTALVALFTGLHALRQGSPRLAALFDISAYVPGDVTWQGVFLGPFFHNHWFHLFGDQLSLYVFGAMAEVILGPLLFWLITAMGLWLSNPLTHAACALFLERFSPEAWSGFLLEKDYGSSNAVFALVGAYSGLLARNGWLLVPFFLYGLFICWSRHSWLSLHHILIMLAGLLFIRLWLTLPAKHTGPPTAPPRP